MRRRKNKTKKNLAVANQSTWSMIVFSHLATFLGYSGPNAALYFLGFLGASNIGIDLLKGQLNLNSGNNTTIDDFLTDPLHKFALGIAASGVFFLTISNQFAYADMIKELWSKKSKKKKKHKKSMNIESDVENFKQLLATLKTDAETKKGKIAAFSEEFSNESELIEKMLNILDATAQDDVETIDKILKKLEAEETNQPKKAFEFLRTVQKFFKVCANSLGTDVKGVVTVAAMWKILRELISNPYISGAIVSTIILPCALLSQFAILGRKQNKDVFKWGLASFAFSTAIAILTDVIVHFSLDASSAPFTTIAAWGISLLTSTLVVAEKETNLFDSIVSWIKESCDAYTKQPAFLVNNGSGEILTVQNKKSSWWDYWCCWRAGKDNAQPELTASLLQAESGDLRRSDSSSSFGSASSLNSLY